ncbi:MAG: type 4a pilus biogenesis protein PilO [Bythopirellula sp.]
MSKLNLQQNRMYVWSLHLAGAAAVAVSVGGFYGLVYQPLKQKQADYTSQSEQLDFLLLKTGTEANDYRRLRNELQETNQTVVELRRQLADQVSETALIDQLRQLAATVDLQIVDYQVGLTSSLPTHSQTELELSCHGSYDSICRFLQQAEQLTKTTKLSKFELKTDDNLPHYPIQVTFVLYSDGNSNDTKEKRGVL